MLVNPMAQQPIIRVEILISNLIRSIRRLQQFFSAFGDGNMLIVNMFDFLAPSCSSSPSTSLPFSVSALFLPYDLFSSLRSPLSLNVSVYYSLYLSNTHMEHDR